IAIQIRVLEGKVRERVRAIDDHFNAALAAELTDSLDGKNLPGEIGDVAHLNYFGLRGDRALEALVQIIHRGRRNGKRERAKLDAVASFALPPRREHSRIILIRREHFIARLEVETEDTDLERFAGVSSDRHFVDVA